MASLVKRLYSSIVVGWVNSAWVGHVDKLCCRLYELKSSGWAGEEIVAYY